MSSNVCCTKTAVRRFHRDTLPWLRRAGTTAVTVAVAALALVTTVGALQAYAIDFEEYPGEMCIKWTGAGTPKYYYGGIGNESTTAWLYLDCPMVTDPLEKGYMTNAGIHLRDLHPSEAISCTLYNVTNAGSNGAYYVTSNGPFTSFGSAYASQTIYFGALSALDKGSGINVNYISCAIPPSYLGNYRSYILAYERVLE